MSKPPSPIARLRRTVVPYPGEDIRSVAARYAALKRLSVLDLMAAGLKSKDKDLTSLPLKTDHLEAFGELAGIDLQRMRHAAFGQGEDGFELLGSRASIDMIVPHWRRIAPGKLRSDGDDPWIRGHWQITCLPCDPDTGEVLLHICTECGATLSWLNFDAVHRCQRCHFDLRRIEPRIACAMDRDLAALMVGVLRRDPSALERMPPMVQRVPTAQQVQFFAWLGALRTLVNGVEIPMEGFATFEGFGSALAFPASFNRMVVDLMSAHEQRDPRFGRLIGTMEMRFHSRKLMPGKIKDSIRERLNVLLHKDEIEGLIVVAPDDCAANPKRVFRLDYREFMLRTFPARRGWDLDLQGLSERQIVLECQVQ